MTFIEYACWRRKGEPNMIPEVGKDYDYFDDGKIRETRRYNVRITEIIPFDKIDKQTFRYWRAEVKQCYWLYKNTTDYFIKGVLDNEEKDTVIFVRTKNDEWFSLGMWGGLLLSKAFWLELQKTKE